MTVAHVDETFSGGHAVVLKRHKRGHFEIKVDGLVKFATADGIEAHALRAGRDRRSTQTIAGDPMTIIRRYLDALRRRLKNGQPAWQ